VTIPNSVTTIGEGAFDSNQLTSVTIPNSVTTIGNSAFATNSLTALTLGNSVTSIGPDAFMFNQLTRVTIPTSVTSIGSGTFSANLLTSVTIPTSVTRIGDVAFGYNELTSVIFEGNAPIAGSDVFDYNSSLTAVTRSAGTTGWRSTWGGKPVVSRVVRKVRAAATVKPTVSGTATVGKSLSAGQGTWTGNPRPTIRYQWYACTTAVTAARSTVPSTCKKITSATRSTFKLTSAQRGKYVAVLVTGTSLGTTSTSWLSKATVKIR
jgi:hypothetical protein